MPVEVDADSQFTYADVLLEYPDAVILEVGLTTEFKRADQSGGTWDDGGWVVLWFAANDHMATLRLRNTAWGDDRVYSICTVSKCTIWITLFRHTFTRDARTPIWSAP